MRWVDGIIDSMDKEVFEETPGDSEGQGSLVWLQLMGSQGVGYNLVTEQQQQKGSNLNVT